tara:strand:- start:84 stop:194 length:111 start_codon:yes stop_codon:yes gene_type:complete
MLSLKKEGYNRQKLSNNILLKIFTEEPAGVFFENRS